MRVLILAVLLLGACGGDAPAAACMGCPEGAHISTTCDDFCGTNDADGDGVKDSADLCPSGAETQNGFEDGDGCPDVSGSMNGAWRGTATLTFQGGGTYTIQTTLTTAAHGLGIAVSPVCPLGDGAVAMAGAPNGVDATWNGELRCAPFSLGSCPFVTTTYNGAAISYSASTGLLGAAGGGVAAGCNASTPFQMTFSGARQ